jgi:beta-lactam-binding protein with PASTA domain
MRMSQKDPRQNNVVLQQVPAAGARAVPQQTTVRLTIGYYAQPATGGQYRDNPQNTLNRPIEPDGIIVPDTVGKSLADARNTAQSRGWSPERIIVHERVVSDPKLAAGVVRSQKPGGGSSVPYKSPPPIELWVDVYKKQP